MKYFLYILLISGLIPATYMLLLTFVGFSLVFQSDGIEFNSVIAVVSMTLGICGYLGLALLLKGFHKTNHYKKLILIALGLIGFTVFMTVISPRDFMSWLFEFNMENLIGKWPIMISITFLILIIIDLIKNKRMPTTSKKV